MEHTWDRAEVFRLGYLCGWAQGCGWASSPWVADRVKKLLYLRRVRELMDGFDGLEPDGLLERWHEMYLEEVNVYDRFSGEPDPEA